MFENHDVAAGFSQKASRSQNLSVTGTLKRSSLWLDKILNGDQFVVLTYLAYRAKHVATAALLLEQRETVARSMP